MKIKSFIIVLLSFIECSSFAQSVLDWQIVKEDTTRKVLPYSFLREADLIWSKRIWRIVDVNEKINLPLKYPLSGSTTDRKSLIDVFADAIKKGSITAYGFEDDEFTMPITWEIIERRGGARIESIQMTEDSPPYNLIDTFIKRTFSPDKVIAYLIKEDWFFDKQRSVMEIRIIGIAPLIFAVDESGNVREGNYKIPLFWIYYPEARQFLGKADAFNRQNNAARLSFDDLFQKRFFGSYIIKESNVYDRRIDEYKQGINALLESEKIKDEITNFEHDMWEF